MATAITDLDELLGEDKRVRLRGKTYTLPPDIPAELYLRIQKYARENPDAGEFEVIEKLYEQALELFRYGDPSIKELPLSLKQVVGLVARVYGDGEPEDEGEKLPPQPPRSGGATRTGSRTRAKRSR